MSSTVPATDEVQAQRLAICRTCEHRTVKTDQWTPNGTDHCKLIHDGRCRDIAYFQGNTCPAGKW